MCQQDLFGLYGDLGVKGSFEDMFASAYHSNIFAALFEFHRHLDADKPGTYHDNILNILYIGFCPVNKLFVLWNGKDPFKFQGGLQGSVYKGNGTRCKDQFLKMDLMGRSMCRFGFNIHPFHSGYDGLYAHFIRFGTGSHILLTASKRRTENVRNGTGDHLHFHLAYYQHFFIRVVHFCRYGTHTACGTTADDEYITCYCFHFIPFLFIVTST